MGQRLGVEHRPRRRVGERSLAGGDDFLDRAGSAVPKFNDNVSNTTKPTVRNGSAEVLVEVRNSSIHGKGTFAAAFLEAETLILEYTGELIDRKTAVERDSREAPDYSCYILQADDDVFIDAHHVEHPAKYINHSCEPNCCISRDLTRAFVRTLRTVHPGEELTYDYGYDVSENVKCLCNAPSCRGRI